MKLEIDHSKHGFKITASDEGVYLASGGAKTPQEAARWLIRHINRKAARVEQLIIDLGILSAEDVEAIEIDEEGTQ